MLTEPSGKLPGEIPPQFQYLRQLQQFGATNTLIALGHNWKREDIDDHGIIGLSTQSKVNAVAAFLLLQLGYTSHIVLSTGKTLRPAHPDQPGEAAAMLHYILKEFPTASSFVDQADKPLLDQLGEHDFVNLGQIHLEQKSYDTGTNATETAHLLANSTLPQNYVLVANKYHLPRAGRLFAQALHTADLQRIPACEVLAEIAVLHAAELGAELVLVQELVRACSELQQLFGIYYTDEDGKRSRRIHGRFYMHIADIADRILGAQLSRISRWLRQREN